MGWFPASYVKLLAGDGGAAAANGNGSAGSDEQKEAAPAEASVAGIKIISSFPHIVLKMFLLNSSLAFKVKLLVAPSSRLY